MFLKTGQLDLMLNAGGVDWALQEFKRSQSDGPSDENYQIVNFLVEKADKNVVPVILKTAIEWEDAELWGKIVHQQPDLFLGEEGYVGLCNGWKAFQLDGVRSV
jgi:hypothetical protein